MNPHGGSIWGNINLCVEIALNVYYIIGDHGEGIMVPKEHAAGYFSPETSAAGQEADGCLYYPKGETMAMPLYELLQKRAALARKMETAAIEQMEQIRRTGRVPDTRIQAPDRAEGSIQTVREGIYWSRGEAPQFLVHERIAELYLTPFSCTFASREGEYYCFSQQASALALNELKNVFPECRDQIVSEDSLYATICQHYPAYREDYNTAVGAQAEIPEVDAPANLFLQEQLDRAQEMQDTELQEEQTQEQDEEGEYGEQVEYGI